MTQSVFRSGQIIKKDEAVLLQLTKAFVQEEEEVEEVVPEYTGPTADDLRREAEAFKESWEKEKEEMLQKAKQEADDIVARAEEAAFTQVKKNTDQAAIIKTQAQQEAQEIINKANAQAQEIIAQAQSNQQDLFNKASKDGFEKGREDGYQAGNQEALRLVERLHKMLDAIQEKRQEILDGTEQQIVDIVLLMTRKVVKIMSDNQKSVIMANVVQALKKVKGRGDVILRINSADLNLTSEHIDKFIKEVENIQNIQIIEDSSVEKGGCIVETDFGAIDARISSQLTEIETKLLGVSPIKAVEKSEVINPDI